MSAPDPLSADDVRTIAHLARLAPGEEQIQSLRGELSAMLEMASSLTRADLEGAQPMTSVVETINRLAADDPGPILSPEQIRNLAPSTHDDGSFRVPPVLGDSTSA